MVEVGYLVYCVGEECVFLVFEKQLFLKIVKLFGYYSSSLLNNILGDKKEENYFQKIRVFFKILVN